MPKYNPLLKCSYFNDARMIFNLFDALFDFFPLFYEDKLLYTKMGYQSEWHNSLQSYLLLNKAKKKNNIIIETVAKQALSASWGEVIEIVRHVSISGG